MIREILRGVKFCARILFIGLDPGRIEVERAWERTFKLFYIVGYNIKWISLNSDQSDSAFGKMISMLQSVINVRKNC